MERSESFKLNLTTSTEGLNDRIHPPPEGEITISEKDNGIVIMCSKANCVNILLLPAKVTVSWEKTVYTVSEDAGVVEVCAPALPSGNCPVQFPLISHLRLKVLIVSLLHSVTCSGCPP